MSIGCQLRQNGNTPVELEHGAIMLVTWMKWPGTRKILVEGLTRLERSSQIIGDFTTCTEMSGNGVVTGMTRTTISLVET